MGGGGRGREGEKTVVRCSRNVGAAFNISRDRAGREKGSKGAKAKEESKVSGAFKFFGLCS